MEQRAQLTQNEVQWYKYLNYTARAIYTEWQKVLSLPNEGSLLIRLCLAVGSSWNGLFSFVRDGLIPRYRPLEDRSVEIVGELLHDAWGVKYDVSAFNEILTRPSH